MILLPSTLIVLLFLGEIAIAVFLFGAWLIWRALRPRRIVHQRERRDGVREVRVETRARPLRWPLVVGALLLLWAFAGSALAGLLFPSGDPTAKATGAAAEQRIARP